DLLEAEPTSRGGAQRAGLRHLPDLEVREVQFHPAADRVDIDGQVVTAANPRTGAGTALRQRPRAAERDAGRPQRALVGGQLAALTSGQRGETERPRARAGAKTARCAR